MPYSSKEKQTEYHRKYYAKNRERLKEYKRKWQQENPEKRVEYSRRQHARYEADPEKYRAYFRNRRIKREYDLTEAEYAAWVVKQGGRCGICGKEPSGQWHGDRMLNVDHDHETGAVRGLLCNRCNRALGLVGDTEEAVQKLMDYLIGAKR
jgi:hypothetical protein